MNSKLKFWTVGVAMAAGVIFGISAVPATAYQGASMSLRTPASAHTFSLVVFNGTVHGVEPGSTVQVERLVDGQWQGVASGQASAQGRFALT